MSSYYDVNEGQRHRSRRHRRPGYEEDEVIEYRGSGRGPRPTQQQIVRRRSDSGSSSTEEISRDFPPGGGGGYVKRKTTRRERPARPRSAGYDDYGGSRRKPRHDNRRSRYDSESDSESVSPRPKRPERRKSIVDHALEVAGIGGAAGAALSGRDKRDRGDRGGRDRDGRRARSMSHGRGRYSDDSGRSRSRSKSVTGRGALMQAGKAAALAGVTEAWRTRKEPGGIQGNFKRIATAAVGAAGIDGALSHDRDPEHHSGRHIFESAVGGVMGNRLIHGSRSRSRSRGRDGRGKEGFGLGGAASAAGLAALAGKAYKSYRSKSRGRRGGSGDSDDSADSRGSRRPERRSRSKSLQRYVQKGLAVGMAKLGLDEGKSDRGSGGRSRGYDSDADEDGYYQPRQRGGELQPVNGPGAIAQSQGQEGGSKGNGSDTDSYSSEEEIKKQRKMQTKQVLTTGLASVATIHAAHSVYQAYEKRKVNKEKVAEGKMSAGQARAALNRGRWSQAAAVGIAALGLKGATDEWKEMKEQREEYHEAQRRFNEKREHRRQKMAQGGSSDGQGLYNGQASYNGSQSGNNPYGSGGVPPPPMGGNARY